MLPFKPLFTPIEVAILADAPKRAVEKAMEEKALAPRVGKIVAAWMDERNPARRLLGLEAVVYLVIVRCLAADVALTIASKRRLVAELRNRDPGKLGEARVEIAPGVVIDVHKLAGAAIGRAIRYARARDAWIECVPGRVGGRPTIKGTRIPVHSVAAHVEAGERVEDIAADNPDIPAEAFEVAIAFARAHPLPGRPAERRKAA